MKEPVGFLNENRYGLLYGDDAVGEYEFIWVSSPEALFERAVNLVRSLHDSDLKDQNEPQMEKSLDRARCSFEESGLSDDTLEILVSNMHERSGISWWGLFDDLRNSDQRWPQQTRSTFREHKTNQPIETSEEGQFAHYVTRHPFEW